MIMNDGRSREPVRTGYMYRGHWYVPCFFSFFFSFLPSPPALVSAGRKCTMGMSTTSSMGLGSHRHRLSMSHPAPSRYMSLTYTPSSGGSFARSFSSCVITWYSNPSVSMGIWFFRAVVCRTAVRKHEGYVNPASQYTPGYVPEIHPLICSSRAVRSRVQLPRGFKLGYAFRYNAGTLLLASASKMASRSADITTRPLMPFFSSLSVLSMFSRSTLYRSTSWNSVTCSGEGSSSLSFMSCS
mmetsp:Transcript_14306/g.61283  ORF Transcript_14306/g.61283 Transcript_14306/m.61283 type:complete len:241 (+) Transcript_14306:251-973(+)